MSQRDNNRTPGLAGMQDNEDYSKNDDEIENEEDQEIAPTQRERALQQQIEELREEVEKLKKHQHLGSDGSRELSGATELNGKLISIFGAGDLVNGESTILPVSIFDKQQENREKRSTSIGLYALKKDDPGEQNTGVVTIGMTDNEDEANIPLNRLDWDQNSYGILEIDNLPQYPPIGDFPSYGFLRGGRTPRISGEGTITKGGDTLVDSTAKFKPYTGDESNTVYNGNIALIKDGAVQEVKKITGVSENVITVDKPWNVDSGTYDYQIEIPIFLGNAINPFSRLYVREDIRFGVGSSAGPRVQFIKRGELDPNGNVVANRGSLYLRSDGSLYVKKSNDGGATGWVKLISSNPDSVNIISNLTVGDDDNVGGVTIGTNSNPGTLDVSGQLTVDGGTLLNGDLSAQGNSFFESDVFMNNLPTSDPAQAGQLWNDAGTLKVSSG